MTFMSPGQGNALSVLSSRPDALPVVLSRTAQRQVARGLDQVSGEVILAAAREQGQAALALMHAQNQQDLALFHEQAKANLAVLHEHGRGAIGSAAILEAGSTASTAEAVAKAYPVLAPQVLKIVEAQAMGAAMAVMGY